MRQRAGCVWENTGSSAVAPPNSTAIRSSEIAPSSAGVSKMKRTPARASDRLASCSATCARPIAFGTSITITIASTAQTAAKAYGTGGPTTCSRPATAGPAIIAACITDISTATARASIACETPAASSGPTAGAE